MRLSGGVAAFMPSATEVIKKTEETVRLEMAERFYGAPKHGNTVCYIPPATQTSPEEFEKTRAEARAWRNHQN